MTGASSRMPVEYWFRNVVSRAHHSVVGAVVASPLSDPTKKDRISVVLVERDFAGNSSSGDSLAIHWTARRWYPEEGVVGTSTGPGADLSEMSGTRALWLCKVTKEKARCSHPFVLTAENGAEIDKLIGLIENPPADDAYARSKGKTYKDKPSKEVAEARLAAVLEFLKQVRIEHLNAGQ
jgi:hypothetical protein